MPKYCSKFIQSLKNCHHGYLRKNRKKGMLFSDRFSSVLVKAPQKGVICEKEAKTALTEANFILRQSHGYLGRWRRCRAHRARASRNLQNSTHSVRNLNKGQ
jgi:hypothetical protein